MADVDGDGIPDTVTIYTDYFSFDNGLVFYKGNGDGTFQDGRLVSPPGAGYVAAFADVDGDGKCDLITLSAYDESNNVSQQTGVLRGNGDGTFQPVVLYNTKEAQGVSVTDLNGDGKLDLLVQNYNGLSVLLNKGNGTFDTAFAYRGLGSRGGSDNVAPADLDGDGKIELVGTDSTANVYVLNATGNGTFEQPLTLAAASNNTIVALADLNADGKDDYAMIDSSNHHVRVFLKNGIGTKPGASLYFQDKVQTLAVGELTGDGKPDLVVTTHPDGAASTLYTVTLIPGNGDGTFGTPSVLDTSLEPRDNVLTNDVNNDGRQDIVVLSKGPYNPTLHSYDNSYLLVFLNSAGGFGSPIKTSLGKQAINLRLGDLNGDGKSDLLLSNAAGVGIYLGDGAGHFTKQNTPLPFGEMLLYDLNRDGKLDLVTGYVTTLQVMFGNGNGTFGLPVTYPIPDMSVNPNVTALHAADINGDGLPDLLVSGDYPVQTLYTYYGKSDGTFQFAFSYSAPGSYADFWVTDLNEDGKPDVLTAGGAILLQSTPLATLTGIVKSDAAAPDANSRTITLTIRPTDNAPAYDISTTTTGEGAFTAAVLPGKDLVVHVQAPGFLQKNAFISAADIGLVPIQVTLPGGDLNNDNQIDIGDFALFVNVYGTVSSDPGYDASADLNSDGAIDVADFSILVNNYGMGGDL